MSDKLTVVVAMLLAAVVVAGCDRAKKVGKDKIDDVPRGTGGTPATQTTQPAALGA